jgi:hypothetical protein
MSSEQLPEQPHHSASDRLSSEEPRLRVTEAALRAALDSQATSDSGVADPVVMFIQKAAGRVLSDLADANADDPPARTIARTIGVLGNAAGSTRVGERTSLESRAAAYVRQLIEAGRSLIATLVLDSRAGVGLAGFRSNTASDEVHLGFECEFARIDVLALREDEGAAWRLRGQITGDGLEPSGVVITPRDPLRADEPVVLTDLEAGGFERVVSPGAYTLAIEFDDGAKLVLASLDLGEGKSTPRD